MPMVRGCTANTFGRGTFLPLVDLRLLDFIGRLQRALGTPRGRTGAKKGEKSSRMEGDALGRWVV
jgi:hypothetical protein